ncbi:MULTISPECIES: 16S rRNA (guanine(966)-N(2))-methyltransferase RsmD [unclassified Granulicatella]|uniref:16S rRNA (guanine(966)-N(2))-methyltransferase RsmD n=1 Tax=unclassified Granulicatella TaxID=2630493 RepID=UPI00107489BB|nr:MULTISPECIES: 16S rRNA (guanine(966)-N(2))-methyltransferase RsmD [unclassified Granulicatella]MBF0780064.1 16S rRNA (guanine(966)-N(2))-methyltransferase RsmD [Granulicatella sp. 19428wC4_WM01]TFU95850.1 16S rRNA (guanine(966)-N(2))-methyltransferase RsmD [Granulicatella sp. WM01]
MRIISGKYGKRKLKSLPGDNTRPTTDKVKESIFNIIGPYFDGGTCLDLFAGSGALSIEAVSRGMDRAILFEKDRKAQQIIQFNIAVTKEAEKFQLIKGDSKRGIYHLNQPVELIFFDPPYAKQTIKEDLLTIIKLNLITPKTMVVCETDNKIFLPEQIGCFTQWKRTVYGTIAVSFYHIEEEVSKDE